MPGSPHPTFHSCTQFKMSWNALIPKRETWRHGKMTNCDVCTSLHVEIRSQRQWRGVEVEGWMEGWLCETGLSLKHPSPLWSTSHQVHSHFLSHKSCSACPSWVALLIIATSSIRGKGRVYNRGQSKSWIDTCSAIVRFCWTQVTSHVYYLFPNCFSLIFGKDFIVRSRLNL
jgi:hypothetical protein